MANNRTPTYLSAFLCGILLLCLTLGASPPTAASIPLQNNMRILLPCDQWSYDIGGRGVPEPSDVYKTQVFEVLAATAMSPGGDTVQNMREHVVYVEDGHWKDYVHHFSQDAAGTIQCYGEDFVDSTGTTPGWITTPAAGYALWYPSYMTIGTAWDVSYTETMGSGGYTYTDTTNLSYTIVATETITVKAGTFETYKASYVENVTGAEGTAWFAPQIGAVVKDVMGPSTFDSATYTQELTSFSLVPEPSSVLALALGVGCVVASLKRRR